MSTSSLDVSQSDELAPRSALIASIVEAANSVSVEVLIVGAFARNLHLWHGHRIQTGRNTADVDFAVAVESWAAFDALKDRLVRLGRFDASTDAPHRLRARSGDAVDLVPFAGVEDADRSIAWPPRGETRMDVFGLTEALRTAVEVLFPGGVRCKAVSLAALAALKIVTWQDRHLIAPKKDAHDLQLIAKEYLDCGNYDRLTHEFESWLSADDFDFAPSGPRMLGHDIAAMLPPDGRERIARILRVECAEVSPGFLPGEMDPGDPNRARTLLRSLLWGLEES